MKKYFLMVLMVFSVCAVADPASARGRVHVVLSHHSYENVMVEDYPQYYGGHRMYRQSRHSCHHCHYRPRAHRQVRYYQAPDYYYQAPDYYYVPQQEVVVYQQVHHWGW